MDMRVAAATLLLATAVNSVALGETAVRVSPPGYAPSLGVSAVSVDGRALLPMSHAGRPSLWRSDGTFEGTHLLLDNAAYSSQRAVAVMDGIAYFHANGEVWRTDGTPAGTTPFLSNVAEVSFLAAGGGRVWYLTGGGLQQLWVADVASGQKSLAALIPFPDNLLVVDDLAYFTTWSDSAFRLFRSDGTPAGTYALALDGFGGTSFGIYAPQRMGGAVYFAGFSDWDSGLAEPWRSEGAAASTSQIIDLVPGKDASQPYGFTPVLGRMFFTAEQVTPALWATDGTAAGTVQVASLAAHVQDIHRAGRLAYFTTGGGCGGSGGERLWRSDGTSQGTFVLADCLGPSATTFAVGMAADAAGRLVFAACDGATGCEPWISDGTAAGTRLLVDVVPGASSSNPREFVWAGGRVFFAAGGAADRAWWSVDVPAPPMADFDRDGYADLCWQGVDDRLWIWYMRGIEAVDRTVTEPATLSAGERLAGCGDIDGDGAADLLFRDSVTGAVGAWSMDASRRRETHALPYKAQLNWDLFAVADIDGDRSNDLLWHDRRNGRLLAWLMNGLERRSAAALSPKEVDDTQWRPAGAGDFDGDGKADILWRHERTGRLVAWLMDGLSRRTGVLLNPPQAGSLDWRVQSVLDLDSDGDADIVWRNHLSGRLVAWLMSGTTRLDGRYLSPSQTP